jgi:rubrerythrin
LVEYAAYQVVSGKIAKAQSLQKLGRLDEAKKEFQGAEAAANEYVKRNPQDKRAHILVCIVYLESGANEAAILSLKGLLSSALPLDNKERAVVEGQLQKLERERPIEARSASAPRSFTQVYACIKCGRLHNYVSLPCPHCSHFASDLDALAKALVLSNTYLRIPALLLVAREMETGRRPEEIVANLESNAAEYLSRSKTREVARDVFAILREEQGKQGRLLGQVRQCPACAARIVVSTAAECQECGTTIQWPSMVRLLVCVDNLLWLLEQRAEVRSSDEFAEFVCLLVVMANDLLRKQKGPSEDFKKYALKLLGSMRSVGDKNNGAVIDLSNLSQLQIYLVKDRMTEDSETFGILWFQELQSFIQAMSVAEAL